MLVKALCMCVCWKAIRRKENGWYDEEHPLVFLFLGSSGIGNLIFSLSFLYLFLYCITYTITLEPFKIFARNLSSIKRSDNFENEIKRSIIKVARDYNVDLLQVDRYIYQINTKMICNLFCRFHQLISTVEMHTFKDIYCESVAVLDKSGLSLMTGL